jgi:putative transposase
MAVTIGFDRNVVTPVVSSDGTAFDYSAEQKVNFQKALKGKIKWQKRFSRKQKGSSNRRKAAQKIGRYDLKVPDIRNDFAHKTSKDLVEGPVSLLVFEDLNIKNMTASAKGTAEEPGKNVRQKAGLNRSILNSGWGKIRSYTQYKGLRKNKLTITIPAHYSSQECSRCGFTHKDNRPSQAEFICQACGFMCNADFNASFVIKKRGVRAVLNNEVRIKIPKKVAFSKKLARRAGTVRTDASASTPVERVSVISASKPICNSRLKQEPPLELR